MHKLYTCLLFLCSCVLFSTAQPGALDLSFAPGTGANNEIVATAIQPDGRILIGGFFTTYNSTSINRIARLNTNGSLDTSFHTGSGADAWVRGITIQPDGKIIIVGDFTSYNSTSAIHIARINIDGSADTSFNSGTGFNDRVYTVALQTDAKIMVGGWYTMYNGDAANRLVRLNTDGSRDTSFHTIVGADASIENLLIQSDGKIVIGGDFNNYGGDINMKVARVHTDGSRDSSFTALPGASAVVFALAQQPDGKVIIGGNFTLYDFQPRNYISRIHTHGGLDPIFHVDAGANAEVKAIKILNNGKVLFAGSFTSFRGVAVNRLELVSDLCFRDTTFNIGSGADERINTIAIQPNGKIIIAGIFTYYNGISRNGIARLYNCLTARPDSIYGNSYALCNGTQQTYNVTPIADVTKYEWTLPSGWIGSSDSASIIATSSGSGGVISVKAFTDSCGFSYATTRYIATIHPAYVPICLVTVDTASTHNIIIWEKPQTALIDSFFIYRETTTNVYTKIGSVPYDSLSEYHDTTANPNSTSYRYKLSVLDTCGAESELSLFHNTIHLQNLGSGNFQWTFYQIESQLNPVLSFNIYRDNLGNGNFFPIGNVPGTNATFTDVTFNSFTNSEYVIDANWSISCTPTRAVNTTRSNIRHRNAIDVLSNGNELSIADMLQVYPNPAGKLVNISFPSSINITRLQIFNSIGQTVWNETSLQTNSITIKQINVEMLPKGVYTLSVETNMGKAIKKLIIE